MALQASAAGSCVYVARANASVGFEPVPCHTNASCHSLGGSNASGGMVAGGTFGDRRALSCRCLAGFTDAADAAAGTGAAAGRQCVQSPPPPALLLPALQVGVLLHDSTARGGGGGGGGTGADLDLNASALRSGARREEQLLRISHEQVRFLLVCLLACLLAGSLAYLLLSFEQQLILRISHEQLSELQALRLPRALVAADATLHLGWRRGADVRTFTISANQSAAGIEKAARALGGAADAWLQGRATQLPTALAVTVTEAPPPSTANGSANGSATTVPPPYRELRFEVGVAACGCDGCLPLLEVYTEKPAPGYALAARADVPGVRRRRARSLRGAWRLQLGGNGTRSATLSAPLPYDASAAAVHAAAAALDASLAGGGLAVARGGGCDVGWAWRLRYGVAGDRPQLSIVNSSLSAADLRTSSSTGRTGGLLLWPIPAEMLAAVADKPQVQLLSRGIRGGCGGNCSFGFSAAARPSLSNAWPPGGAAGTLLTLTGSGFSTAKNETTVDVGGVACAVRSVSASRVTCAIGVAEAGFGVISMTVRRTGLLTSALLFEQSLVTASLSPAVGSLAGGTAVTIVGEGFRPGNTAVSVGGASTAVLSVAPNKLTIVTPPSAAGTAGGIAGAVDVVVTVQVEPSSSGRTSIASAFSRGFAYSAAATPTVAGVAPIAGSVAGGTLVLIRGAFGPSAVSASVGGAPCALLNHTSGAIRCRTTRHAGKRTAYRLPLLPIWTAVHCHVSYAPIAALLGLISSSAAHSRHRGRGGALRAVGRRPQRRQV